MILLADDRIPVEFLRFAQSELGGAVDVVVVSPPTDLDICEMVWASGRWDRDAVDMPDDTDTWRADDKLYVRRQPTAAATFDAAIAAPTERNT